MGLLKLFIFLTVLMIVSASILETLGFSEKGIQKNSVASFIQSCIGNVEKDSLFSKVTSYAMKKND